MKIIYPLIVIIALIFSSCMEMDSFLFNTETIDEYQLPGNTIPDSLIEQVTLKSDGNMLYGYWITSNGEHSGITFLYCHGNKHNIDEYWDRVMFLHKLGVNIFIFDYRGFGKSEGESSQQGLYDDGKAALNYVLSRPDINTDSLCFYGYSLGNVVSIYLASEVYDSPYCLFAEAPFASAGALTQSGSSLDIPANWLTNADFNNAERISKIKTKFLLFHGADDDFVRYVDNGKVVYENAPDPKKLVLVADAVHINIPQTLGVQKYLNEIKKWLGI